MIRGEIWWGDFGQPRGSAPAYRRPVLIIQANAFNRSTLRTVMVIPLTTNMKRAPAPGNVLLTAAQSGLARDSVALVSQVMTVDRGTLSGRTGRLPVTKQREVDEGLRLALAL